MNPQQAALEMDALFERAKRRLTLAFRELQVRRLRRRQENIKDVIIDISTSGHHMGRRCPNLAWYDHEENVTGR